MRGHNRAPPLLVPEEMMTALNPQDTETCLGERYDEFLASDTRSAAHAAIVTR